VKDVKDELREGDQILVKVLSIEGNRIKLSRKAVLREQRAKLGLPEVGDGGAQAAPAYPAPMDDDEAEDGEEILLEGGAEFDDDDAPDADSDEPNFNRAEGAPVPAVAAAGGRGPGGPSGFRGPGGSDRRPGGRRRRGGGGRRPGGPGGGPPGGGNR
jgi:polyribonucleotide nucleotidyltransferase